MNLDASAPPPGLAGWLYWPGRRTGTINRLGEFDLSACLDPVLNLSWIPGSGRDPGLGRGPRGLWVARLKIFYRWEGVLKTLRPAPIV